MKSVFSSLLGTVLCLSSVVLLHGTPSTTPPTTSEAPNPILRSPAHIDGNTLRGIRLLEISGGRHFSSEEIAAVTAFVKGGGALLVVMDEENRTPLLADGTNALTAPFGLGFTPDTEYLHNCGAIAKAGVVNPQDRELPYSGGRAIIGGTAFAWRLDAKGSPADVFAAYVEVAGGGRIVALAEGMAYLGMGSKEGIRLSGVFRDPSKTTYWGKDSKPFMDEVRSWLLGVR